MDNLLPKDWKLFSPCERVCLVLLAVICLTTIFSTAIVQICTAVLTAAVGVCIITSRTFGFHRTVLDVPYLAFVTGRVISVFFSQYPEQSIPALYIEFCFYVVFFLVTQAVRRIEVQSAQFLTSILMWAGAVAALIGISKVLLSIEYRASSTTAGTYTLGAYLCAVLPFALVGRQGTESKWLAFLYRMAPAFICFGIVFTYDRLHWVGMLFSIAAVVVLIRARKQVLIAFVVLLVCLLLPSVRVRLDQIIHIGSYMDGRDALWRGAAMLITAHPLAGFGPRTFHMIFPQTIQLSVPGINSWHSDYLQVYLESGLLGLLPLIWIVTATCYYGFRFAKSPGLPEESRRLSIALLVGVITLFIVGGMLDVLVGILFRILLGLLAVLIACPNYAEGILPAPVEGARRERSVR